MAAPILASKLYIPPPRAKIVFRPRLIERLNEGLSSGCMLTLISAPAGFGKTTLLSEWVAGCERPASWLSLEQGDSDPTRFLAYLIAALQTLAPNLGDGVLAALQSPQLPHTESILATLLNEIAVIPDTFTLVLDDYHVIDSQLVDQALVFLIEHLPPQMHLVIATREDPHLPMSRLRARGHLTELRGADLRFTPVEAAEFLNRMMGLNLRDADVAALEARTEGWIAGLQMAALSLQQQDATAAAKFIEEFSGSHRYIMDYLVDEVLQGQPAEVQNFLLYTSVLDQLCSSLCESILPGDVRGINPSPIVLNVNKAQEILIYLEHANLFITPLNDQRHWYRYHHLLADLLRHRLSQIYPDQVPTLHLPSPSKPKNAVQKPCRHRRRPSIWLNQRGFFEYL